MEQTQSHQQPHSISSLMVEGYKSLAERQEIAIAPLTILEGANSSGKSSMMQPLLLLKQTMEATFDPGPLLLNGANVKIAEVDQFISPSSQHQDAQKLVIGVGLDDKDMIELHFSAYTNQELQLERMVAHRNGSQAMFQEGVNVQAFENKLSPLSNHFHTAMQSQVSNGNGKPLPVVRDRCFLHVEYTMNGAITKASLAGNIPATIRSVIHLPGLRGSHAPYYPVKTISSHFPGTFDSYVASVIEQWQTENDDESVAKYHRLCEQLRSLGLTSSVKARRIDETRIELLVSRFVEQQSADTDVNIADAGMSVSQTLPVLVALLVAEPGQLVYIEEPEIYLHPRAQIAMADILTYAAQRGVRVVLETHSMLLVLAVQTLVAEGKFAPELIKLHWFALQDGITYITTTDVDRAGAVDEDWPEDFAAIDMDLQIRYLNAAETIQREMVV